MIRSDSASRRSDPRAAEEGWDQRLGEELWEEWNQVHRVDRSEEWDHVAREVYGQFDDGFEVELTVDWSFPPLPGA